MKSSLIMMLLKCCDLAPLKKKKKLNSFKEALWITMVRCYWSVVVNFLSCLLAYLFVRCPLDVSHGAYETVNILYQR